MCNSQKSDQKKAAGLNPAANQNSQNYNYHKSPILQANCALEEAIDLVRQGIPVFPCLRNKAPACDGGFKSATTDANILAQLWSDSALLVGVPTGEVSGIDVLDIDPRHCGDTWYESNYHRLPHTRIHKTVSGGIHILFKHHQGLRNSAGKIAPGVDVRANGGYVVWWPAAGLEVIQDLPIVDWPDWLLEDLKPKPRNVLPDLPAIQNGDVYALAALKQATLAIATAPTGLRNDTLNREAWSVLRFVEAGQLQLQDVMNRLAIAAYSSGLARPEVTATLASALSARGLV